MKKSTISILAAMSCTALAENEIQEQRLQQQKMITQLEEHGYNNDAHVINGSANPTYAPLLGDLDHYRDQARDTEAYIDVYTGNNSTPQRITSEGIYSSDEPLILSGTIEVHGSVVVENDIILNDVTIKGMGALFSSRNIHVFGNIRADQKPYYNKHITERTGEVQTGSRRRTYNETNATGNVRYEDGIRYEEQETVRRTFEETRYYHTYKPRMYDSIDENGIMHGGVIGQCEVNNQKGAVALAAKGNIMIGDIRELERTNPDAFATDPYVVDNSDAANGYTTMAGEQLWRGRYDQEDGGYRPGTSTIGQEHSLAVQGNHKIKIETSEGQEELSWTRYLEDGDFVAVYNNNDPNLARDTEGNVIIKPEMIYSVTHITGNGEQVHLNDRLPDFGENAQLRVVVTDHSKSVPRKYFEPTLSEIDIAAHSRGIIEKVDPETGDITEGRLNRVDAILYTNHLLAGRFYKATFFGSMISRNRKLLAYKIGAIYDIRAKNSALSRYLPLGVQTPRRCYRREL